MKLTLSLASQGWKIFHVVHFEFHYGTSVCTKTKTIITTKNNNNKNCGLSLKTPTEILIAVETAKRIYFVIQLKPACKNLYFLGRFMCISWQFRLRNVFQLYNSLLNSQFL